MLMDGYNLYLYLLMCIDAYNLRWVSIDNYVCMVPFTCFKCFKNGIKMGDVVMG